MTINKIFLSGNLTDDCSKHGSSENPVCFFSIAVNDKVKRGDKYEDITSFIDCKVFGKYAKALAPSLNKGVRVSLEGKIRLETWDKDGEKHSKIVVYCDSIEIFSKNRESLNDDKERGEW